MNPVAIVVADGRSRRRQRNVDALLAAAGDLLSSGVYAPTSATIAERSGVSLRSVFRHFETLDALFECAILTRYEQVVDVGCFLHEPSAPFAERIGATVAGRLWLHREAGGIIRAALALAASSSNIRDFVDEQRQRSVFGLATTFARELAPLTPPQRNVAVAAAHAAVGFESCDKLLRVHGLPPVDAAAVLAQQLRSALSVAPA